MHVLTPNWMPWSPVTPKLPSKWAAGDLAPDAFVRLSKEYAELGPVVSAIDAFRANLRQVAELTAMLAEGGLDPEMRELAEVEQAELKDLTPALERAVMVMLLPKDSADERSAILEVRAGTGGEEAALFAANLFRMYQRYADARGWRVEILSESASDLDGLREVVANITGQGVFARLKYESGVHRVQRVPETEAGGRIHTSAATVAVLPEAEEVDVQIEDKDLRIDVFRASGPGGQSVNTTDSAVRITHLPTGLVVSQQDEKSQHKNKAKGMKVLRARLYELQRSKLDAERAATRKGQVGSGDRSERIRTYNFPQGRVTDHRINLTLYKLDRVMLGELDELIDALIGEDQASRLPIWIRRRPDHGGHDHSRPGAKRAGAFARGGVDSARLDAQVLLAHVLDVPREQILRDGHLVVESALAEAFEGLVQARLARKPISHLVGHREFWSLDLEVTPDTLDPRADSETVVDAALRLLPDRQAPAHILDLGTGSGALLLALLSDCPWRRA